MLGNWKSSPVITKHGPILTAKDIPYKATLIFNAGVTKMNGKYIMAFRNDFGDYHTDTYKWDPNGICVGIATSDDGIHWTPEKTPWFNLADGDEILAPARALSERNHHDMSEMRMFRYPTKKAWEEAYDKWLSTIKKAL